MTPIVSGLKPRGKVFRYVPRLDNQGDARPTVDLTFRVAVPWKLQFTRPVQHCVRLCFVLKGPPTIFLIALGPATPPDRLLSFLLMAFIS